MRVWPLRRLSTRPPKGAAGNFEELGVDYGGDNMATNRAGILFAECCMQRLGYRKSRRKGKLTEGSVAKTGEIFLNR
jgi:hypothetical protein